jgi:hypothetical protein
MRRLFNLIRPVALGASLVMLSGCDKGTGEVSGTVTYNGAPLPGGIVTFIAENGRVEPARIGEDGSYKVTNVPVGPVRITVTTPAPLQFPGREPQELLGKYVAIPKRYGEAEDSGFTFEVKKGSQRYDLPLSDGAAP